MTPITQSEFFELIYGYAVSPQRRICIFTCPGERSQFFESPEDAEAYIRGLPPELHVYHGMSLVSESVTSGRRGKAEEMMAYGALWCDVDIASPAHPSDLPPTIGDAVDLLDSLPIQPSLIVDSGWGIHGYWILEEQKLFDDASDRQKAASAAKGWHGLVCSAAAARGWKLSNLGDLPRVLRTPGTVNCKQPGLPKPVRIIRNTGEVVAFEDLERLAARAPEPAVPQAKANGSHHPVPSGLWTPLARCMAYLDTIPGAVEGSRGGAQTLVACKAIFRFGLEGADVRAAFEHYNAKCIPPWKIEKQIEHKLSDAAKSVDAAGERGRWLEDGFSIPDPSVDLQAILAMDKRPAESPDPPSAPEPDPDFILPPVGGLIGEIVAWNLKTALYPQPELALAGAIALMGVLTGRKVCDSRGTRTNVYVLSLAPSGGGKEHARKVNKEILQRAGKAGEAMIGPERIGSSAGLVSSVAAQPAILFQLDEIGRLLSTMKNPGKQPHLYNIGTVLLQLYSSADSLWIADAYADQKKTKRINQPHACIYGTSVPDAFWDNLTAENVSEGFLGRLLTFEARTGYVPMAAPTPEPPPESILEAARWWLEYRPNAGSGNLGDENPAPYMVGYSAAARERMDSHLAGICERRTKESPTEAAVWSRSGEKSAKLALILACSRASPAAPPRVELEDVDAAILIANQLTRRMLRKAFEHVSENETESRLKKLLRQIKGEMTLNELTRRTQWLRGRERQEILADLRASGLIQIELKDTGGRPVTIVKRQNLTKET
jgi:hypothetical protein